MDTSNVSARMQDTLDGAKGLAGMLRDRSAGWLSSRGWLGQAPPIVIEAPRRPAWQSGMPWFVGGVAVAMIASYFLDAERGSARRHMAYDRTMAGLRDLGDWSGKKARHLRNRAQGTMAEMRRSSQETEGTSAGAGR
jgi:hypothetical protein